MTNSFNSRSTTGGLELTIWNSTMNRQKNMHAKPYGQFGSTLGFINLLYHTNAYAKISGNQKLFSVIISKEKLNSRGKLPPNKSRYKI